MKDRSETHRTMSEYSYHGATSRSLYIMSQKVYTMVRVTAMFKIKNPLKLVVTFSSYSTTKTWKINIQK